MSFCLQQSLLDRSGLNAHSILQAVEGLLDATSGADADLLLRYRECHLLVLKALQDGRAYGPQWCNKQITRCVYVGTVFVQNGISCIHPKTHCNIFHESVKFGVSDLLHVRRCLIECRDEYKYNVEAVELLIRNHLVNMQQYDLHLAQVHTHFYFCG